MGCNIHTFIEYKDDEGEWQYWAQVKIWRYYGLFAIMAGVRNKPEWNITPKVLPKGLPEDLHFITQTEYDSYDAHTPSWFTPQELFSACAQFDVLADYVPVEVEAILGVMEHFKERSIPVRLIFWFDN